MNTLEQRMEALQEQFAEINTMSFADLEQRLATIPPLMSVDWPDNPISSTGSNTLDPEAAWDAYFDKAWVWDQHKKEGLFNAVGHYPIRYVCEQITSILLKNKLVVLVGEDQEIQTLLGGGLKRLPSDFTPDLSDHEYAMELRDVIALEPIGAVVLINQDEKLQHVDLITNVQVFRGNRVVTTKKIPVFHIHTEPWQWVEKCNNGEPGLRLNKEVFEKVTQEKPVQVEDDRVGCIENASDIRKEHRLWLWPGFLGRNKVAHFGGASTEGKSPVTLDIIARVTSGSDWPDGTKNELGPRSAILLAAEDDWSDTIIPRLEVAGADLKKVKRFFVRQQTVEITPSLDSDCQRLEKQIEQIGDVALVVIDPITNYLGSKKMNMEDEIRGGILMPLSQLAKNKHCAVVTVGHLNKRGTEVTVLQRLMGCAAFSGVARDVFIFGSDPEDEDKYAHIMSEIRNKSAPKLKYRTEVVKSEWEGNTSEIIRVKWCGVSQADVDDVVNAPKPQEKSMSARAVALIIGMLRSGEKRKSDIDQALKENGIDLERLNFDKIKKRCKADTRPLPGKAAGWCWFLTTPKQEDFDA